METIDTIGYNSIITLKQRKNWWGIKKKKNPWGTLIGLCQLKIIDVHTVIIPHNPGAPTKGKHK